MLGLIIGVHRLRHALSNMLGRAVIDRAVEINRELFFVFLGFYLLLNDIPENRFLLVIVLYDKVSSLVDLKSIDTFLKQTFGVIFIRSIVHVKIV